MVSKRITKKFLSDIFDKLYKYAYEMNKRGNYCKIRKLSSRHTACRGLYGLAEPYIVTSQALCCVGCRNLGLNGCKVKALACKLWYCNQRILIDSKLNKYITIFDNDKFIIRKFPYRNQHHKRIIKQAIKYNLIKYRAGKTEAIEFAWDIIKNNKPSPYTIKEVK